jgi:hypothetical protein
MFKKLLILFFLFSIPAAVSAQSKYAGALKSGGYYINIQLVADYYDAVKVEAAGDGNGWNYQEMSQEGPNYVVHTTKKFGSKAQLFSIRVTTSDGKTRYFPQKAIDEGDPRVPISDTRENDSKDGSNFLVSPED